MPTAIELLADLLSVNRGILAELQKLTARKETVRAARRSVQSGTFSEFWDLYPRRVGKMAAEKAYSRALCVDTHAAIMAGVVRFKEWVKRNQVPEDKTPHPATWLNAGRWMDEDARKKAQAPAVRDPSAPNAAAESPEEEARRLAGEWTDAKLKEITYQEEKDIKDAIRMKMPAAGDAVVNAFFRKEVRERYGCPHKI